ncbi:NUDIX hydrolase [Thiosulfatihalobacter marinus]|uniref:NUDIX hydrolase n=1 Tax=Thiosulfatihalobacter marinus TaxID=2792481 RepID=UPI0018DA2B58|nr:NUDIX hydrolase [Thiosulfatihalobacter marinus]
MTDTLMNALSSVVGPLLRRPKRLQVAALCLKGEGSGKQVLMITSRDTGRWVLPKGWPIDGYDAPGSALQEAWEEAGVKEAEIDPDMIGTYEYAKRLTGGAAVDVEVQVYSAKVDKLVDQFPESDERSRKWVSPMDAANMVQEPGLQELLRQI